MHNGSWLIEYKDGHYHFHYFSYTHFTPHVGLSLAYSVTYFDYIIWHKWHCAASSLILKSTVRLCFFPFRSRTLTTPNKERVKPVLSCIFTKYFHSLLMRMQNGTAIFENNLVISYKTKHTLISNHASWYLSENGGWEGWIGRTQRIFRAVKLHNTKTMDKCHYTFVPTHRMYITKSEP